jgi:hypothetical protein
MLPISELTIETHGREGAECAALPGPEENSWTEPPEKLVLNWPRVMEKADATNQAAWVKLGTSAVSCQGSFLREGLP